MDGQTRETVPLKCMKPGGHSGSSNSWNVGDNLHIQEMEILISRNEKHSREEVEFDCRKFIGKVKKGSFERSLMAEISQREEQLQSPSKDIHPATQPS